MKIHLFSTYDGMGGAAVSFLRLAKALHKFPVEVECTVQRKYTDHDFVNSPSSVTHKFISRVTPKLEYSLLKMKYSNMRKSAFSTSMVINNKKLFGNISADIIHLHWTGHGLLNIAQLKKLNKPVVLTLHDMSPFTGGCYYSGDCVRYMENCGKCHILNSDNERDLSRFVIESKLKSWKDIDLTVIAPGNWMAVNAMRSSVFKNKKIVAIPYCINTNIFQPVNKCEARKILNLPQDKRILLFGAVAGTADPRKGFGMLKSSLEFLKQFRSDIHVAVFGQSGSDKQLTVFPESFLGVIKDEYTLALIYSAADLFLMPSREDNLPNTIIESLSCGTPVAAYKTGGIPDLITHRKNGFLAQPFNTEEFAEGIRYLLEDEERLLAMQDKARKTAVENHAEDIIAKKHINLYNEILSR